MSFTKTENLHVNLDAAFKPKSIAIIGASNDLKKLGGSDMKVLIESGFEGAIYPINPKEKKVQGYTAYKTVLDVPDDIDRATIILPTRFVLSAVKECAEKGIKVVQIYSAGFGEFGDEGRKIESEMVEIARKHNMRIIGPNCIGTYCPEGKISFATTSMIKGNIAFVSQSGGIAFDMVNRGGVSGIHYSKVISVGNCIDLDHADYLEYLKNDENTKVIGLYIESVKDGQKFLRTLKEVTKTKPVIILKGGRTESGSQSVASHTGNLAGSYQIWEALFEQTGAIPVKSIEEMLTVLLVNQELKPSRNNGSVALIGNGGGATVLATDYLEEVNLQLVNVTNQTHYSLSELGVSQDGRNVNPIDLPAHELATNDWKLFGDIIRAYSEDVEVEYILFHLNLIPFAQFFNLEEVLEKFIQQLVSIDSNVNLVGVLRSNEHPDIEIPRYKAVKKLQQHGIPIFRTIEQAAFGISSLIK